MRWFHHISFCELCVAWDSHVVGSLMLNPGMWYECFHTAHHRRGSKQSSQINWRNRVNGLTEAIFSTTAVWMCDFQLKICHTRQIVENLNMINISTSWLINIKKIKTYIFIFLSGLLLECKICAMARSRNAALVLKSWIPVAFMIHQHKYCIRSFVIMHLCGWLIMNLPLFQTVLTNDLTSSSSSSWRPSWICSLCRKRTLITRQRWVWLPVEFCPECFLFSV